MDGPPAIARLYNSNDATPMQQTSSNHQPHVNYHQHQGHPAPLGGASTFEEHVERQQQQQQRHQHQQQQQRQQNHHNNYSNTNNYDAADSVSHPLHPVVDQLRNEVRELKMKLEYAEDDRRAAIVQAKADTYLHVVRVLKSEGVPGVERLKTMYGGDAAAAALRQGGGTMMLGGGASHRMNSSAFSAPNVQSDVLTREELHSGLRRALRNM